MSNDEQLGGRSLNALTLAQVEMLMDHAPRATFSLKDQELRYVGANRAMLDLCGVRARSEFFGRTSRDFFPETARRRYENADRLVMRTRRPVQDQLDLTLRLKGAPVWVLLGRWPVFGLQREVLGVAIVARRLDAPDRRHPTYARLARALDEARAAVGAPLDMGELAHRLGVSISQCERDFIGVFGMQSFIRVNTFTDTIVEQNRIAGFVRGDLFELPAGPIAAVFGFEYRDDYAGQFNDNEQRSGNIFGFNAIQDQEGSIDVYELYTEMAIPLVSEQPFAHYLGLEAGYRRSNYSSVGNVDTYKIGGEWAPTDWLRFRAIFNEATRAPNVFELFRAGDQGFQTTQDPCRDVAPADGVPDVAGVTAAECIATGVPAVSYPGFSQQNQQLQVLTRLIQEARADAPPAPVGERLLAGALAMAALGLIEGWLGGRERCSAQAIARALHLVLSAASRAVAGKQQL